MEAWVTCYGPTIVPQVAQHLQDTQGWPLYLSHRLGEAGVGTSHPHPNLPDPAPAPAAGAPTPLLPRLYERFGRFA